MQLFKRPVGGVLVSSSSVGEEEKTMASSSLSLFLLALLTLSILALNPVVADENEADPGLVMNFYKDSCPQAEDIVKEQVKLLYKRHKNTAFSWLRNIFHDCAVQVRLQTCKCKIWSSIFQLRFPHICSVLLCLLLVMWCFPPPGLHSEDLVGERDR